MGLATFISVFGAMPVFPCYGLLKSDEKIREFNMTRDEIKNLRNKYLSGCSIKSKFTI